MVSVDTMRTAVVAGGRRRRSEAGQRRLRRSGRPADVRHHRRASGCRTCACTGAAIPRRCRAAPRYVGRGVRGGRRARGPRSSAAVRAGIDRRSADPRPRPRLRQDRRAQLAAPAPLRRAWRPSAVPLLVGCLAQDVPRHRCWPPRQGSARPANGRDDATRSPSPSCWRGTGSLGRPGALRTSPPRRDRRRPASRSGLNLAAHARSRGTCRGPIGSHASGGVDGFIELRSWPIPRSRRADPIHRPGLHRPDGYRRGRPSRCLRLRAQPRGSASWWISVCIWICRGAAASDDIADNDRLWCLAQSVVADIERNPLNLIEALADRIAQTCLRPTTR